MKNTEKNKKKCSDPLNEETISRDSSGCLYFHQKESLFLFGYGIGIASMLSSLIHKKKLPKKVYISVDTEDEQELANAIYLPYSQLRLSSPKTSLVFLTLYDEEKIRERLREVYPSLAKSKYLFIVNVAKTPLKLEGDEHFTINNHSAGFYVKTADDSLCIVYHVHEIAHHIKTKRIYLVYPPVNFGTLLSALKMMRSKKIIASKRFVTDPRYLNKQGAVAFDVGRSKKVKATLF